MSKHPFTLTIYNICLKLTQFSFLNSMEPVKSYPKTQLQLSENDY